VATARAIMTASRARPIAGIDVSVEEPHVAGDG
jgi:hypothetical protein